jgi:Dolichyl-phosphate-mannose-protein mannosyltransferase
VTPVLLPKKSYPEASLKLTVPPGRRRGAAAACVVAVLASAAASADLFNGDDDWSNAWASLIGHAGGLLMVAFVAFLCLKCLKELRSPGPAGEISLSVPAGKFTTAEKCIVYFGALALQLFVLYFAFLTTGRGFSVPEFWHALLSRFTSTDAIHYLYLAEHGYQGSGVKANLIVFYPLYPSLIWLFKLILGSYVSAGLFVSWACWGGACVSMLELAAQRYDRSRAALAALLLALYPFSFFSMGVFTESVFLLLSTQCLLRIEKRQWLAVGVLGFLAALCRTQGVLLIIPSVYVWLLAHKNKEWDLKSLYLLLIPAGFGGYLLLNKIVAGHWTAYVAYQKAPPWYQSTKWISGNLIQQYGMAKQYPGLTAFIYGPELVLYFIVIGVLFYGLLSAAPTHVLLYGGAYLGISYLSSWLISGPRYLFGCLPLFLLAARPRSRMWQTMIPVVFAMLLFCYGVYYMQGQSIM